MVHLTTLESDVLDVIPIGSERKISIKEVGQLVSIDERYVYEVINSLRKKGVPVCAQRNGLPVDRGYFIATNESERAAGLSAYKSQVKDMENLITEIEAADLDDWRSFIE